MPELPEVEAYRTLAETALGRVVATVHAPDAWFLKGGVTGEVMADALVGRPLTGTRRIGKLLLVDTGPRRGEGGDGPVLGLRFGMSGRLLVDGRYGVGALLYTSDRDEEAWDRFGLDFADGGSLRLRDPRRLGAALLDPDEAALGPDALSVTPAALRQALAGSGAPLKARLLDQAHVAGIGNLLADEALWRAGLDPRRPARTLTVAEHRRLHRHLRATLDELLARGGSHHGDLMPARHPGGACPRDGTLLVRATVGGRTSWFCPKHQR